MSMFHILIFLSLLDRQDSQLNGGNIKNFVEHWKEPASLSHQLSICSETSNEQEINYTALTLRGISSLLPQLAYFAKISIISFPPNTNTEGASVYYFFIIPKHTLCLPSSLHITLSLCPTIIDPHGNPTLFKVYFKPLLICKDFQSLHLPVTSSIFAYLFFSHLFAYSFDTYIKG